MKKEEGTATVVGFVLILTAALAAAVLFAAVVLPAEESYAKENSVLSAKEDMISFSLLLEKLKAHPETPVSYLPVFKSDAAVTLQQSGEISIGGHKIPLSKLSFSAEDSEIQLSAGGIARSDNGNTVWLSFPKILFDGITLTFVIPEYHGEFSKGAGGTGIPVTAEYLTEKRSSQTHFTDEESSPVPVVYSGDDIQLWNAAFHELQSKYPSLVSSPHCETGSVSIRILPQENELTITIISPEYVIS